MFRIIILFIGCGFLLAGCNASKPTKSGEAEVVSAPKPKPPSREEERPKAREYCAELLAGLPENDPMFELKGKVKTKGYSGYEHEVAQFGKQDVYHEYFVQTPDVPGLINPFTCGKIPFYQMSKLESRDGSSGYKVTLKNGQTFISKTMPTVRHPDKRNRYIALVGGVDKEKMSWFWYVVNDPRYKKPREINLRSTDIQAIEIY